MVYLSQGEVLFLVGMIIMVIAVILAVISIAVFAFTGKSLKKKLEKEYGKL